MDTSAKTVANFLKFYNPSLVGGSLGQHIGEVSSYIYPSIVTMSRHACI